MNDSKKTATTAENLMNALERLTADTSRLVVCPPVTKSAAIKEYQSLVEQAELIVLKAKDLKHEATGRF